MRLPLAVAVAGLPCVLLPAQVANAGSASCYSDSETGSGYFAADVSCTQPAASSATVDVAQASESSTDPDTTYTLQPLCMQSDGISDLTAFGCGDNQLSCGQDGLLYDAYAHSSTAVTSLGQQCIEPGDPIATATAPVLTPGRILEAFRRVPLPEASLEVQPPGGETLVNFDTILHTQAEPFTETVQLLGRQVTFDISPASFTWNLGNGESMTTTDPGRPWARGVPMEQFVSHRYTEAGPVTLDLTTTWGARWRLGNGPWRDVDGTVTMTSPAQDLQVRTAQPQLVSYD